MTDYINKFNENKNKNTITMSLKVDDKQLLKNYSKIWQKIERLKFDNEHSFGYDDKYIKTKIKTYKDSIISNFYNIKGSKKIPREKKIYKTSLLSAKLEPFIVLIASSLLIYQKRIL